METYIQQVYIREKELKMHVGISNERACNTLKLWLVKSDMAEIFIRCDKFFFTKHKKTCNDCNEILPKTMENHDFFLPKNKCSAE